MSARGAIDDAVLRGAVSPPAILPLISQYEYVFIYISG